MGDIVFNEYLMYDMTSAISYLEWLSLFVIWFIYIGWVVIFRGPGCKEYKKLPVWLQEMTLRENLLLSFGLTMVIYWILCGIIFITGELQAKVVLLTLETCGVNLNNIDIPTWLR